MQGQCLICFNQYLSVRLFGSPSKNDLSLCMLSSIPCDQRGPLGRSSCIYGLFGALRKNKSESVEPLNICQFLLLSAQHCKEDMNTIQSTVCLHRASVGCLLVSPDFISQHIWTKTQTDIHTHTYIHVHTCTDTHAHTYTHARRIKEKNKHTDTHTHTHTHTGLLMNMSIGHTGSICPGQQGEVVFPVQLINHRDPCPAEVSLAPQGRVQSPEHRANNRRFR